MKSFKSYLKKRLKDKKFKALYEKELKALRKKMKNKSGK